MEELLELYQEMGISPAVYAYGEKALEGLKNRFAALTGCSDFFRQSLCVYTNCIFLAGAHYGGQHHLIRN